jgi:hypothetical protein
MKKLVYSLIILISSAGILAAQSTKVAILDFKKTGITDTEYYEFSEYLRKEINNKKNAILMGRDAMNNYFAAQKFNSIGCVDNDCASEASSILKSDIVLFGMVVKNEKRYAVTVGVYYARNRDKSFIEKFESETAGDLKKEFSRISDKIASLFPKEYIKAEDKGSWEDELKEKDGRKYNLKYNIGLNTSYLIMLNSMSMPVLYNPNPFQLGLKFQVELFDLMKFGVIGEIAFPLTPPAAYTSNLIYGSGGAIFSFTTSVYKKYLYFIVDLAFLGGVYSYSSVSSLNIGFLNISPRIGLQYFPASIFGFELSVGYNYYISVSSISTVYKIPDAISVGLNFIFRL